jgi:hypothetical protein
LTAQGSDSQGVADEVAGVASVFQVGDEQHPGVQLGDELLEVLEDSPLSVSIRFVHIWLSLTNDWNLTIPAYTHTHTFIIYL